MKFLKKHRKILVPQSSSGRHVDFTGFTLCFMSVLLLSFGLLLICISIWCIVRKAAYYVLLNVKLDVPYFTLPAGILSCSSFWIAASLHNNREKYRFLYLLIFLLTISLILIASGVSMGMMKGSHASELTPVSWEDFNRTLQEAFSKYNSDKFIEAAWDKTQSQLQCCGLNSRNDYRDRLPDSCCNQQMTCLGQNVFPNGCSRLIKKDLLCQKKFLQIHCYIVGIIEGVILIVTANAYYFNKIGV